MRITNLGTDYLCLDESNYLNSKYQKIPRIHLIKLEFNSPDKDKINKIIRLFPKTNRFVVDENIREYNFLLKDTSKKYYVMNKKGADIISFLRKNNKILLNFLNMDRETERFLLYDKNFVDALRNTEVIAIDRNIFDEKSEILNDWAGNIIIASGNDRI